MGSHGDTEENSVPFLCGRGPRPPRDLAAPQQCRFLRYLGEGRFAGISLFREGSRAGGGPFHRAVRFSAPRTARSRVEGSNGFWRKAMPSSSTPWWTMASSV